MKIFYMFKIYFLVVNQVKSNASTLIFIYLSGKRFLNYQLLLEVYAILTTK